MKRYLPIVKLIAMFFKQQITGSQFAPIVLDGQNPVAQLHREKGHSVNHGAQLLLINKATLGFLVMYKVTQLACNEESKEGLVK